MRCVSARWRWCGRTPRARSTPMAGGHRNPERSTPAGKALAAHSPSEMTMRAPASTAHSATPRRVAHHHCRSHQPAYDFSGALAKPHWVIRARFPCHDTINTLSSSVGPGQVYDRRGGSLTLGERKRGTYRFEALTAAKGAVPGVGRLHGVCRLCHSSGKQNRVD